MDVADNDEFTRRLVGLGELFEANLTPVKQALYFEALRDLPFALVAKALNQATRACTFMPKPAELRKLVVGDDEDAAERAWMAFRTAMRSAGSYASLVVVDPALADAITAVFESWPAACALELSPEMWANKRKEFGRVYRVLVNRGLVGARYLPGICEQANAGRPDWMGYVPVKRLDASGVLQSLTGAEAEQTRTQIAAQAHGFTRFEPPGELRPIDRGDTA